ncbi:hypothetical protein AK812_SmicGene40656 [Symbiodinium microadriaticum]|uniref:Integrase catalytic domain-containing protein n=1 Tax=Symbiodinium microadriaticum TaxID=2951 RepID=A0A1Q9C869_SYMMI|nr:hypothetical protein AK812_SmicGene40656 [Symbiodinium microadriaticum]
MMYESFRTRDRLYMIVTLDYLIKLQYPGDIKINTFKQTWLEILGRMRPEDVPSGAALRDTLHGKIKDSPMIKTELLVHYDMLAPKRSYQNLLGIMDRCIMRRFVVPADRPECCLVELEHAPAAKGKEAGPQAREVLVVRDVATRAAAALPTESRHIHQVVNALRKLIGRRKVKLAYSDVAPEFEAEMSELRIPIDHAVPGLPKNNSLAKEANQELINTVAASLFDAGVPAQYWPFALSCVTYNLSIEDVEGDGDSWKRMIGEDFNRERDAMWCEGVLQAHRDKREDLCRKLDPKRTPGIFAGYIITTGQQWSRKYPVWDMAEFAQVNLSMNEAGLKHNVELGGKELKDKDDDDWPPGGNNDEGDDDDKPSRGNHPPEPAEGDEFAEEYSPDLEEDSERTIDDIGDLILALDMTENMMNVHHLLLRQSMARGADRHSHDEVGPTGRLIPKDDDEEPSAIIIRLKELQLAPEDIEH